MNRFNEGETVTSHHSSVDSYCIANVTSQPCAIYLNPKFWRSETSANFSAGI
jgi:hypothetical protein